MRFYQGCVMDIRALCQVEGKVARCTTSPAVKRGAEDVEAPDWPAPIEGTIR